MQELMKQLPNGGAVVAIILVVCVFLYYLEKIVTRFVTEVSESRRDYLARLDRSDDRHLPGRK